MLWLLFAAVDLRWKTPAGSREVDCASVGGYRGCALRAATVGWLATAAAAAAAVPMAASCCSCCVADTNAATSFVANSVATAATAVGMRQQIAKRMYFWGSSSGSPSP